MSTFVIACGGTGGHLSPGIAIAQELSRRNHRCILIISRKQIDEKLIEAYPELRFVKFPGVGFSRKPWKWPYIALCQVQNFIQSLTYLRRVRADVVVGFGGFLTIGVILAAYLLNRPCVLHEANYIPGRATRLLHPLATCVYLPEGVHMDVHKMRRVKYCGFPIRKEFRKISRLSAHQVLGLPRTNPLILIIGGSQGAKIFNQWVIENFETFGKAGIDVVCVTGIGKGSDGKIEEVQPNGTTTHVIFMPFYGKMNELFCAADLVIGRAGAGTIAELIECETPSILIPYPSAADNHQHANALTLERRGGCLLLPQEKMNQLADEAIKLLGSRALMEQMSYNLRQLKRYDAAERMADDLEQLCRMDLKGNFSDILRGEVDV
jgi:UDP-N-acetylglucosamine--N-acetylmuramyl-(pentapeptide) pyrophosphoryl-undecaprenol N-acetylglucosamine transferase